MAHTPNSFSSRPVSAPSGLTWGYRGPDLENGPLPAFFFFFTSVMETLDLAPIRELADSLSSYPMRIFCATLPHHGPGLDSRYGVQKWMQDIEQGCDCLTPFLENVLSDIEYMEDRDWIDSAALGVGGLSRGGFIALQLAARSSYFPYALAFAPLVDLFYLEEFRHLQDNACAKTLQLSQQVDSLIGKPLALYVGNRDERVGTERVFAFTQELANRSYDQRLRSPPVELTLFPSIGFKGHGTPPEVFRAGAQWVAQRLNVQPEGK